MKTTTKAAAAAAACAVTIGILGAGSAAMAAPKSPAPSPSPTATTSPPATPTAPSVFVVDQSAVNTAVTHNGSGSALDDLAIKNGQIYAGYGDYDANVGPVDINSYNLGTGAATTQYTLNGEEAMALRVFDGNIYVPDIDSKLDWTAPVGYATDAGGSWAYTGANDGSGMEHVFDVAKVGNNIFVAGSMVNPDKAKYGPYAELAVIKQSTDNGKTWTIARTQASTDMNNGYDRYYWLGVAGGKVYAQAALDGQAAPLEVWSNGTWTSTSTTVYNDQFRPGTATLGSKGLIPSGGNVAYYDSSAKGKAATTRTAGVSLSAPANNWATVDDLYVDGTTAYAVARISHYETVSGVSTQVSTYSSVYSSTDGVNWTHVKDVAVAFPQRFWNDGGTQRPLTDYVKSIAVSNGVIYLGGSNGTIYKTPLS